MKNKLTLLMLILCLILTPLAWAKKKKKVKSVNTPVKIELKDGRLYINDNEMGAYLLVTELIKELGKPERVPGVPVRLHWHEIGISALVSSTGKIEYARWVQLRINKGDKLLGQDTPTKTTPLPQKSIVILEGISIGSKSTSKKMAQILKKEKKLYTVYPFEKYINIKYYPEGEHGDIKADIAFTRKSKSRDLIDYVRLELSLIPF